MSRHNRYSYLFLALLITIISCDDETSEDCGGILCPFVGDWQLTKVIMDGIETDGNFNGYQLNLKTPEGGAVTADYTRAFGDGQEESGSWTVTNNSDVIVLSTGGDDEEYIVQESGSNRLVLVLHRESAKPGPEEIIYVFTK